MSIHSCLGTLYFVTVEQAFKKAGKVHRALCKDVLPQNCQSGFVQVCVTLHERKDLARGELIRGAYVRAVLVASRRNGSEDAQKYFGRAIVDGIGARHLVTRQSEHKLVRCPIPVGLDR